MQVTRSHDRIGGWTLVKPIGKGGMGQVFKVHKITEMGQSLLGVMKLPLATNVGDESTIRRWKSEVRVMTLVQGRANVVQILDVGTDGGIFYYVMEYVHGADLSKFTAALRRARVKLTPSIVAWIIGEVLNGLASVHSIAIDGHPQNVCHKDIALKNVLASTSGDIKLADFGIATVGRALGMSNRGTLNYMAPEHFMGAPTQKSDVFATMVCAWELLEGERYRPGLDEDQLRASAYATPIRTLRRTDLSPQFAELIYAGLSPLEADRCTADEGLVRIEGLPEYRVERRAVRELLVAHVRGIQGSGRTELVKPQPLVTTPDLAGLFAAEMVLQNAPPNGALTDDEPCPDDVALHDTGSRPSADVPAWPSVEALSIEAASSAEAASGPGGLNPPSTLRLGSRVDAAPQTSGVAAEGVAAEPVASSTLRLAGAPPPPALVARTVRIGTDVPSPASGTPSSPTPRITMPWGVDETAARSSDVVDADADAGDADAVDTSDEVTPMPVARIDAPVTGPAQADPVTDRLSDPRSTSATIDDAIRSPRRIGWVTTFAAVASILAGATTAYLLAGDDPELEASASSVSSTSAVAPRSELPIEPQSVEAHPSEGSGPIPYEPPVESPTVVAAADTAPASDASTASAPTSTATASSRPAADDTASASDPIVKPAASRKAVPTPKLDVAVRVMWIDVGVDVKVGRVAASIEADGTMRVPAGKHRVRWRERGTPTWTDAGVQEFAAGARHVLRIGKTGGPSGVTHDVRPEGGK